MPIEKKHLELKYASKRFGKMDADELDLAATKAIVSICIITGWTPPAEEYEEVMVSQLSKKMAESYQNLNMEELEYAFRNKGLNIKDWGKVLNLALIDDVLMPFLDNRFDISVQEEKIRGQVLLKQEDQKLLDSPAMSEEEWQEWLLDIAKYPLNKIPTSSYDYLERTGQIVLTKEEKHGYMERSIAHLSGIFDPISREGIEFEQMKKKGIYSVDITATLITTSKRLAVFDYFNKIQNEKKEQPNTSGN